MAEIKLKAEPRAGAGKGVARQTRRDGKVPGVIYGRGMDALSIAVDRRDLALALNSDSGMNTLLDIELDGDNTLALTKELQRHPVRGTLLHADFIKIDRKEAVEVEVPIHVVGESPGVKEGGVLEHLLFMADVRCLPTDVPETIDADVSSLQIGDSLRVAELVEGRKFDILNDPEDVVVNIATPVTEEQLEALEAEAGITTEVPEIGEEEAAEAAEDDERQGDEPADSSDSDRA